MIKKACLCLLLITFGFMMNAPAHAELIVLASPIENDPYYEDAANGIFEFHTHYAKQIIQAGDDVLILTTQSLYDDYVSELGEARVIVAPMLDIWMRDFSLSNAVDPVMFRYTAAGQSGSQKDSDEAQETLAALMEAASVPFKETNLLNDGGNFVDDYAGSVVVSKKFLVDNKLSEEKARKKLKAITGAKNIAFIEADEQGGLEHADGVVSFVDSNTLIINSYPEDQEYAEQLKSDLKRSLPNVKIHEIVTPYDDSVIHDKRFGSACGLYTNALVTPDRIYLPQFGIKEDALALEQVRSVTTKEVIPVLSNQVCHMGGGVRCMSWQVRGQAAEKLLSHAAHLKN